MSDFSRTYRLTSKQEFQFVFSKAKKVAHAHLLALYRSNQKPNARLGIMIGKQYVKRAVQRNELRRHIRESFRLHKEIVKGLDIIVLMRSEWTPSDPDLRDKKILRENIDNLWRIISKMAC